MSENTMLQEAIDAIHQGQRARARELLNNLLQINPTDPEYWLWMSSVVDTQNEEEYYLENVLRLDPGNREAQRRLALLGVIPPGGTGSSPLPKPGKRAAVPPARIKPNRFWENRQFRITGITGILLIVLGLLLWGLYEAGFGRKTPAAWYPTKTPGPSPTYTLTPTYIPITRSASSVTTPIPPSPTYVGLRPLWMGLEATYTPTPMYVMTAHPISEAFKQGEKAYREGSWEAALDYLRQASRVDPHAADILYHIGEIHRRLAQDGEALKYYEQAITTNPGFAPAYLGRARALLALDADAEVLEDLDHAIAVDPGFGEAYLERAAYRLAHNEPEAAQADLDLAGSLLPQSPLRYLYLGQAALQLNQAESALEFARKAVELDATSLPAFLLLGQAALLNGEPGLAEEALQTYTGYITDNAAAWLALGQIYLESGQKTPDALDALTLALSIDDGLAPAYYYRGLAYLETGEYPKSVRDFQAARRFDKAAFPVNLALGQALLANGQLVAARNQLLDCLSLARTDEELGRVYYWQAQTYQALSSTASAAQAWQAMLTLPTGSIPQEWAAEAAGYLDQIYNSP